MTRIGAILSALQEAGQLVAAPEELLEVTSITDDSRHAGSGSLFCAVVGTVEDGHRYVGDALQRGATAALVTHPVEDAVSQIVVRDSRAAASIAAREWYGRPGEQLTVVGVTGTNGKTTTVALIRHLLNTDGTVGSMGTLGAFDGLGRGVEGLGNLTTPGSVVLQAALAALKGRGVTTVVMEASSHALDQRRLETLAVHAAVYTNLTHEHLDYHGSADAYRAAKMRLSSYLLSGGLEAVNVDDDAWRSLPKRDGIRRVPYGRSADAVVRATQVELDARGATFTIQFDGTPQHVRLPLLGDFNVSNALAAAATAWGLGIGPATIASRLGDAPQIAGRMERIVSGDFVVLRDYAHTSDALERAIAAIRPVTSGRLIVLFGAGGDRDRSKRPLMGAVAARGADLAVVTSDNPRTEDPDRIVDDIEAGMQGTPHLRVTDRRAAIQQAIGLLKAGDCLLLAGKGHETYQVVGTERVPFDEREIVGAALRERTPA